MDYRDYMNHNDINFAVMVLEEKLKSMKESMDNRHWLSPQVEEFLKNIEYMESAIKKIKAQWDTK